MSLHGSQVAAGAAGDVDEVARTVVGHGVMLEIFPDAFDGIHIRRVGGQVVDDDLAVLGFGVRVHELRAVRLQAIPFDEHSVWIE